MEQINIGSLGLGIIYVVGVICVLSVIFYTLRLLGDLVRALERIANALEMVARKTKD